MNVRPGGQQGKMRPGWYMREGVRLEQSMVFNGGPFEGLPIERFGEDRIQGDYD